MTIKCIQKPICSNDISLKKYFWAFYASIYMTFGGKVNYFFILNSFRIDLTKSLSDISPFIKVYGKSDSLILFKFDKLAAYAKFI